MQHRFRDSQPLSPTINPVRTGTGNDNIDNGDAPRFCDSQPHSPAKILIQTGTGSNDLCC